METQTTTGPSPTGSSPAAAYPRTVLLYFYSERDSEGPFAADPRTTAAACSTTGHAFRVSFHFAPPPEVSTLLVGFPDGAEAKEHHAVVLAAHGDSVLFQMSFEEGYQDYTVNQFVYNAGTESGPFPRPPAVLLLPPYYLTGKDLEEHRKYSFGSRQEGPVHRRLHHDATGLLRHGGDEFVVAEVNMVQEEYGDGKAPELLLLRSGEWSIHRPAIIHGDEQDMGEVLSSWETRCVLPLSNGLLCWVDVDLGLLFCNVFDEIPELRFVPLPGHPCYSNVSVTAGGNALKFVNIFPRCCCGARGTTTCQHAYTVHTWIMRIDDDMVWVMDGVVDSTEIWALDAYKGLPRVHPVYPYASLDDPHIICFELSELYVVNYGSLKVWFIMLDLRNKMLLSSCHLREGGGGYGQGFQKNIFPCRISDCFNAYPSSSGNGSSSTTESHLDIAAPSVEDLQVNNGRTIRNQVPIDPAVQGSEILAVFQEIPSYGLATDDLLKAFSILSRDTGRRFNTLLELPMSMRKDWLLREIKASES